MSSRQRRQYGSAPGIGLISIPGIGILFDNGPTVPTDGTPGYAPGCTFVDIDASGVGARYLNIGTFASCDFNQMDGGIDLATLTASAAELNQMDNAIFNATIAAGAGAGITGGTGTIYKNNVEFAGGIYSTRIMIDLTGLASSTTDLDIIGVSTTPAYIGRVTAAQNGATILMISMQCLEAPAGGVTDIDLYSATEATGKFDDAVTGLTETALITSGGAWTNGATKGATVVPVADEYLYLTGGAAGTAATYTAGKFLITIYGYT